jgi:fluoride exporter
VTPLLRGGVAAAGALGAVCRLLLDAAVARRVGGDQSHVWGIAVVNVLGSLGAGAVAGVAARGLLPAEAQVIAATGFLGAFTTFSTWMVQAVTLLEERRIAAALGAIGSLLAGVLAALCGLAATR